MISVAFCEKKEHGPWSHVPTKERPCLPKERLEMDDDPDPRKRAGHFYVHLEPQSQPETNGWNPIWRQLEILYNSKWLGLGFVPSISFCLGLGFQAISNMVDRSTVWGGSVRLSVSP